MGAAPGPAARRAKSLRSVEDQPLPAQLRGSKAASRRGFSAAAPRSYAALLDYCRALVEYSFNGR